MSAPTLLHALIHSALPPVSRHFLQGRFLPIAHLIATRGAKEGLNPPPPLLTDSRAAGIGRKFNKILIQNSRNIPPPPPLPHLPLSTGDNFSESFVLPIYVDQP